ncbi:MAG: hypothetical protein IJX51_03245 [Clostridia bacterium]|nr:hypothetical protein [Clostridia bacterium]
MNKSERTVFDIIIITVSSVMGYFIYYIIGALCNIILKNEIFDKISMSVAVFVSVLIPILSVYIKHFSSRKKRESLICQLEAEGYNGIWRDLVSCIKKGEYTVILALFTVVTLHLATRSYIVSLVWEGAFILTGLLNNLVLGYFISFIINIITYYTYLALSRRRFYYSLLR